MGSFIRYKKEKIQQVFKTLGSNHTEERFIAAFKSIFPADWQRIQDQWLYEEQRTPLGKKHPMPHPDVYMKEMYRNHQPKQEAKMANHRIFFSFEYNKDAWRAAQIRNTCLGSSSVVATDRDWEEIRVKSDSAVKAWIDERIAMCDCVVVLIGTTTASRKWVLYEIEKACELNKGIVGIYIHKIRNIVGDRTGKGKNPFEFALTHKGEKLSDYVVCYDSPRLSSEAVCDDIAGRLEELVENAMKDKVKM